MDTAAPGNQGKKVGNGVTDSTHPYTDKASETLHSSVDKLASSASRAEERLRDTAAGSAEKLSESQKEMEAKWQKSGVRNYAVNNPIAAAGIAFAAGMLVSSLFRKK